MTTKRTPERIETKSVRGRSHWPTTIGRYIVLVVFGLIFIFPIVLMVVSSLKPDLQLLRDTSSLRAFLPVGNISFSRPLAKVG